MTISYETKSFFMPEPASLPGKNSLFMNPRKQEEDGVLSGIRDSLLDIGKKMLKYAGITAIFAGLTFSPVSSMAALAKTQEQKSRPNVVFILTDNQYSGTLGCYGNEEISTPNVNRLADQGITFRSAFACNGMCSPTRASILTGLMPTQNGIHAAFDDRLLNQWPEKWCAVDEFRTLPQTLKEDGGYETALIGKYHLGNPYTTPGLFFDYWVTFPAGHTDDFYNTKVIDNGKTYVYPGHATDLWTEKAVEYIGSRKGDRPFFLFLTYNGPYNIPPAISRTAKKNRYSGMYAGREMKSSPQLPINPFLMFAASHIPPIKEGDDPGLTPWGYVATLNDQEAMRNIASEVSMVDEGVGRVLDALRENGLDDNTLVIFTSDQGAAYGQKGLWGQSCITFPSTVYDPQIQIPLIFRHTNHINPSVETHLVIGTCDFFPTILEYVGLGDIRIDNCPGKSFAPFLKGEKLSWQDRDGVFVEQEQTRGIRTSQWMYCKRFKGLGPEELYDMKNDPDQMVNIAGDLQYADVKKGLEKRVDEFFEKYSNPEYDLWKGGTCKSNSHIEPIWKGIWPGWKPVTEVVEHPFTDK